MISNASRRKAAQTKRQIVSGKIIRSGYLGYGAVGLQPIIEVNGRLQFSLPGQPIFPALADSTILKPTLLWLIETDAAAQFDAELSYVTGEMGWEADYNLVLPERGDTLDMVGWITMDNESGRTFEQARIKLMAGDVNKIQSNDRAQRDAFRARGGGGGGGPPVTEKSFDEYHLYTLERPTTLLDREKKQVEFVSAAGVMSVPLYIYDGASMFPEQYWYPDNVHTEAEYGTKCNRNVWVMREFTNSAANHLGLPLPKGRVRVYRRNSDGQMEFTGESMIKHTPRDEVIRLVMGNAFDLVGERKRTDFKENISGGNQVYIDPATGLPIPAKPQSNEQDPGPWLEESFEIRLRNHKQEAIEIRAVEHQYRWVNWKILEKSDDYRKTDAQTIEFRVPLKPDEEKVVTYKVRVLVVKSDRMGHQTNGLERFGPLHNSGRIGDQNTGSLPSSIFTLL